MRWTALALLVCCLPCVLFGEGRERITNGGLEGPYRNGFPEGWRNNCYGVNQCVFSEETGNVHGGKSALKADCTSFEGGAIQFLSPLKLRKGKYYRCSFWLRAHGGVDTVHALLRQFPAPYRKHIGEKVEPSTDWREYVFEGVCLDGEEQAGLFINFKPSGSGTIWLDDVSVVEMEPTAVVDAGPVPERNVVPDGSFEVCPWRDWRVVGGEGSLDDATAAIGKRSLRVALGAASCQARCRTLKFGTGRKEFTLSVHMKAESLSGKVRIDVLPGIVISGQKPRLRIEAVPTGEWRRYTASGVLEPSPNGCFTLRVLAPASAEGVLWIDGLCLQPGGSDRSYTAAAPVEYALSSKRTANIFRKGESVRIVLAAQNSGDQPANQDMVCRVVDFRGSEATRMPFPVSVLEGRTLTAPLTLSIRRTGAYRAELMRRGEKQILAALCFSVLPPVNPTPAARSNVGGHFTLNEFHRKVASLTGIKWTRIHDASSITHWQTAEPEKGTFEWFDGEVELARKHGVEILGEFLRTPEWASSAPDDTPRHRKRVFPPRDMAEFENYVRTVVGHYKDRIHHWEIWNEPYGSGFFRGSAEQYARLAQAAVRAAKTADPACRLLAPCTCGSVAQWTDKVIDAGGLNGVDIFSYHGYGMLAFSAYEKMAAHAARHRKTPLPIWNTETGATSESFYTNLNDDFVDAYTRHISPMPYDTIAARTVRYYVMALAGGAERFFLYWTVYESGLLPRLSAMTFLEYDGSLRPFGVAYAVAASLLDGAVFHKRVEVLPRLEAFVFRAHDGKAVAVLFSSGITRGETLGVTLPLADVTVADIMGSPSPAKRDGGVTVFSVARMPCYLIAGTLPGRLAEALRGAQVRQP